MIIRNKLESDPKCFFICFLDIEQLKAEVGNGNEIINRSRDITMELNARSKKIT
jgi:hypothetical protein